ncbi:V-set domain-containing T-cell activation inhibitor 1 [Salminus brasiliensis]|uniref:V-set domain-containing T-cell activation inhibitor 1 n=1 Tax=Salminus brasiliensis TaxID=930266 RepID=UPI003B839EA6
MASIGQIIFWSMIVLIFVCAGLIILLLAIAFSASQGTVKTSAPFPVGNLGQDVVLECRFLTKTGGDRSSDVLITWEKDGLSGLVYQYKNNAAQLQDQNSLFQNRAQLFPDAIAGGNASLVLRSVRMADAGVYRSSVSAPGVWGRVDIDLRVSVYSVPTISKSDNGLKAEAPRWQSNPTVIWSDQNGKQLNSSTQFNNVSEGIVQVVSNLTGPLTSTETYTCVIQNPLIKSVSAVTGDGDLRSSYFLTSSSPKALPLQLAGITPLLLYMLE